MLTEAIKTRLGAADLAKARAAVDLVGGLRPTLHTVIREAFQRGLREIFAEHDIHTCEKCGALSEQWEGFTLDDGTEVCASCYEAFWGKCPTCGKGGVDE